MNGEDCTSTMLALAVCLYFIETKLQNILTNGLFRALGMYFTIYRTQYVFFFVGCL